MQTYTQTYTTVDIQKTFANFHADLRMLAINTGQMLLQTADNLAHDVVLFATMECVSVVHIQQTNAAGTIINANRYSVETDATWDSARPGNNQWPRILGGNLSVILEPSDAAKIYQLQASGRLKSSWVNTNVSTNYSHMRVGEGRLFSSNGYGLRRESFSSG